MNGHRPAAWRPAALAAAVVLGLGLGVAAWLSWQQPEHAMRWLALFSLCGA